MIPPPPKPPLETVVRHASDIIHWVEGSGLYQEDAGRLVTVTLHTLLEHTEDTPPDLHGVPKSGHLVLWRRTNPPGLPLCYTVSRAVSDNHRARPEETAYSVNGKVADPAGIYNPREFTVEGVGNFIDLTDPTATGHQVPLYRSPLGTRFGAFGGLEGNVRHQTGEPASWALLNCSVTPGSDDDTEPLSFHAQADIHGDFRLAFVALRFPEPVGGSIPTYSATLTVEASVDASGEDWADPDAFAEQEIIGTAADEQATEYDLIITPGSIQRPISHGGDGSLLLAAT